LKGFRGGNIIENKLVESHNELDYLALKHSLKRPSKTQENVLKFRGYGISKHNENTGKKDHRIMLALAFYEKCGTDEALCLATLLSLDVLKIVQCPSHDKMIMF